jgi:transcription initiation factor TFIIIB Brf1 subunit/transcription initiation factor TFIIB
MKKPKCKECGSTKRIKKLHAIICGKCRIVLPNDEYAEEIRSVVQEIVTLLKINSYLNDRGYSIIIAPIEKKG